MFAWPHQPWHACRQDNNVLHTIGHQQGHCALLCMVLNDPQALAGFFEACTPCVASKPPSCSRSGQP